MAGVNPSDAIDYSVGLDWIIGAGMAVDGDTPLCRVHAKSQDDADRAAARILSAIDISATPPDVTPLIIETVT